MRLILKNIQRLGQRGERINCEVLIEGDKIKRIDETIDEQAEKIIDGNNQLLLPGFIDVHVHLREPGDEHKETIETGTKAAARGGFTTICAMPNTNPVPDRVEVVEKLFEKIKKKAHVRVLPYASITKNLKGKKITNIDALTKAGAFAFTDDGMGIQNTDVMFQAMKMASKNNRPIVAHCEDESVLYGGVVHDGEVNHRLKLPGIPSISESVQIARDVLLAEATNCHYHVCHVSTKESVRVIRDAKAAGISVTAEVTPHHLLLNETDITGDDADFKMNPPLRSKEDQKALIEGLIDGTIDMIATDHAPHTQSEKDKGFLEAPFGIIGLETAFPLLYTHFVKTGRLTLKQLVDRLTKVPAETFNLPYGKLEEGAFADLILVDLQREKIFKQENFVSKSKNSPFHQWKAKGFPTLTIVGGNIVFKEEKDE